MLLENPLAPLDREFAVPDALGINKEPRAAHADAETARLGAHHRQTQLGATAFQVVPDHLPLLHGRALGAQAEKKMPFRSGDTRRLETFRDGLVFGGHGKKVTRFRNPCQTNPVLRCLFLSSWARFPSPIVEVPFFL